MGGRYSTLAIIGGLTVAMLLALAAILFVAPGSEATQRLALFFGILAIVVPALIGMLRADQGQRQTNGSLDNRMESAVFRAQAVRRRQIAEDLCKEPEPEGEAE